MNTSLYFDSHTNYLPFPEVDALVKKNPEIHSLSFSLFNKDKAFFFKAAEQDIFRLLGLESSAYFEITYDEQQAFSEMIFYHYVHEMFISGRQHVLVLKDKESSKTLWEPYARFGVYIEEIEPHQGLVTVDVLKKWITPRTSFVSIPWASPLTGIIQPVEELSQFCKEKGIAFHTDISFIVGKKYLSLKDLDFTYITCEAKPFHGPWNVGFLINRKKEKDETKEDARLLSLKEALYLSFERIDDYHLEVARMRALFEKKLMEALGDEVKRVYEKIEMLPSVSLLQFPLCMNETFLAFLAKEKVFASCGEKNLCFLSRLLPQRGITQKIAKSAISFYFPYLISQEQVLEAVERITRQYEKAKSFAKDL